MLKHQLPSLFGRLIKSIIRNRMRRPLQGKTATFQIAEPNIFSIFRLMMLRKFPVEALIWSGAFLYLYLIQPAQHVFTLCPLALLGVEWCPGCGLGLSIHYLLHGNFYQSLQTHWFGTLAVVILIYRIGTLIRNHQKLINNYERHH